MKRVRFTFVLLGVLASALGAQTFQLPTTNGFIFVPGGAEQFYVGTVGRPWTSGTFGCVRTEGWQMHEGLDIRCQARDAKGEPIDPVLATAAGTVAYINHKGGLSNYGRYIILRHTVEGFVIYSLYAHLRSIKDGLAEGQAVAAGETIAVLGRSTNTRQPISKERAHLHFELNLLLNDRFSAWHEKNLPGQRNDHGKWNGRNLVGLDPARLFLAQDQQGKNFSLLKALQHEKELFRVTVRDTNFPWVARHPQLIKANPVAASEGVAGYEIAFNFNGVAFELTPRAASELKGNARYQLLDVHPAEYQKNPCRRLVVKKGSRFELGPTGQQLLSLLTY